MEAYRKNVNSYFKVTCLFRCNSVHSGDAIRGDVESGQMIGGRTILLESKQLRLVFPLALRLRRLLERADVLLGRHVDARAGQ